MGFLADVSAPRVVERERQLLDRVEHEFGVLTAALEQAARERDGDLSLLDYADLRLALGDLRERTQLFSRCLERDALGVEGLFAFVDAVTGMGVADIKVATSVEEVADAIGRAVDDVQDYMIGHDLLDPAALSKRTVSPQAVRKFRSRASLVDVIAWDVEAGGTRAVTRIEIGSGESRASLA